jgi:predicted enzyme involved in methoxymalonyl-ACP biosynthesis
VDTLLLSCRVLAWGVEKALAAAACRIAAARGGGSLEGRFVPTAKNAPAAGFYRDLGFSAAGSDAEGSCWRLPLPARHALCPPWIDLAVETDGP